MLVGSVSDNWATNALIETVGLERVQARARSTVPGGSMLFDLVRDQRTASTPETLSMGAAADLEGFMARLHMVAAAFGLDPLSHAAADRGIRIWNKTRTDDGVRADVGIVEIAGLTTTYAVVCNWDAPACGPVTRDAVLETVREIGQHIRTSAEG